VVTGFLGPNTAETSLSQDRCGAVFAAVGRAGRSASVRNGCPAARACCRAASPSLNTTRTQPNAFPKATRRRPRVEAVAVPELHLEANHVHLPVNFPPSTAPSRLVNSL
jgi:hypothetical protein